MNEGKQVHIKITIFRYFALYPIEVFYTSLKFFLY